MPHEMAKRVKLSQTESNSRWPKERTTMKSLDELEHQLNPLSVKEAAAIYGDSPSNFYRMIRRGEVPGVFRKEGSPKARIKICPREFVAWLRQQMAASRGVNRAAVPVRSNSKGTALSTERDEQERSLSEADHASDEKRREGNVA